MNNPLVSIIIPVYNGSNYVRDAIESALSQTYKNIEVIVVNDGSRDDGATEGICLSYGDKIHYIHKENGGVSSALNLGIKIMRGEWFSWLSHDDVYEKNKIESQINVLNKVGGGADVLLCESKQIDANGLNIKNSLQRKRFSKPGVYSAETALENLFRYGSFNGCALLVRRNVFDRCGMFDEKLRYSQDALMWYKICLNGIGLVYCDDICVCNRVHNKQLTQTGRSVFFHDSVEITKEIVPLIIHKTKATKRLLYLFTRRSAIWNSKDAFSICMQQSYENNVFSIDQRFFLHVILLYGKIRPCIRRLYYAIFKGVVTH